ncbi:hypothetical protein WHT83_18460 [Aminobacter sp. P9b]|uniref:Uncharacterized protein n=1 Tax=Aminobacter niigataensis TaxID=83265 RepID=A0ABR6KWR8_9HYPH|nr:hypothetical protein [Aminobacter niigataensis]MBB4648971.1 hypothetical protein [Aminobacter niigataensis]CAI2934263.1 conserved protein of unknown function [Aminobacter niigataensis]
MSFISDLVEGVVDGALKDILKKTTGTSKRTRRRKRTTSTSSATLRQIEKLLRPAKKQTSRKRTVRSRSKVRRRA